MTKPKSKHALREDVCEEVPMLDVPEKPVISHRKAPAPKCLTCVVRGLKPPNRVRVDAFGVPLDLCAQHDLERAREGLREL